MLHRLIGTFTRHVDAFVMLSEFQRKIMVNAGLSNDLIHVKPNFFAGKPKPLEWDRRGNYVVFAGRLSVEKGVESLIRAWLTWGESAPELRILGDGPLRETLEKIALSKPRVQIRFIGQLASDEAEKQIAEARLLVLPSVCFEGFPMVIREAFAYGTPVAASDAGPLPSIVRDGVSGLVFKTGDFESLREKVHFAWNTSGFLEKMGERARAEFAASYTEEANYDMLMGIYSAALAKRRG
jgi:glycosyltransferase involved in cell wall biosynthesis